MLIEGGVVKTNKQINNQTNNQTIKQTKIHQEELSLTVHFERYSINASLANIISC